jgi:hypothetical protein
VIDRDELALSGLPDYSAEIRQEISITLSETPPGEWA